MLILYIGLAVIVLTIIGVLIAVLVQLQRQNAELYSQIDEKEAKLQEQVKKSNEQLDRLKALIRRLSKFSMVADAETAAEEMFHRAEKDAETMREAAKSILDTAKVNSANLIEGAGKRAEEITSAAEADARATESKALAEAGELRARAKMILDSASSSAEETSRKAYAVARQEVKDLRERAKALLDSATIQATRIVERANKRAEEIAGSAYGAMKNAALLEQTAKAMKNVIEGYGNLYLMPGHSLLDDLALAFGHTQAGEELKSARQQTKRMIENATAATCDYVETGRQETAVNFVIDAFNGKVDSVLSRVRHDNAAALEREIRDAFTLVNFHGKAFRNARITEEYLSSRIDELKWASLVQKLKADEREEQRRIKEEIRDEEKARRDFERVQREAAKDEALLQKAMEKATALAAQATADQKAYYEEQLADLARKLRYAKDRGKEAMSLAQLTKTGHVYIISNIGSFGEEVYKIGLTRRYNPFDRVDELGDSSVPFDFDVHAMIKSADAPALEALLHRQFVLAQLNKVNHRREFFKIGLKEIRNVVDKMGLDAKWTMAADASDYRNTLAIEKAIQDDPVARDAWVRRQLELESIAGSVPDAAAKVEEADGGDVLGAAG